MPNIKDVTWFKSQLGDRITASISGTPFTLDMVTAIACQETGYIWQVLRKKLDTVDQVLALCVGDTIDASSSGGGRSAFPKNKAALLAKPRGDEMFKIARQALEDLAQYIPGYQPSVQNPDKFCRGFGIFQYDLQFFEDDDPDFFLNREWTQFDSCMAKFIKELTRALRVVGLQNAASLSDQQMAYVAIAYNTGKFDPARDLKQGYRSDGKYYGEMIAEFITLAKSSPWTGAEAPRQEPADEEVSGAETPGPTMPLPGIERYRVIARHGLRLRQGPGTEFPTIRMVGFGTGVGVLRRDGAWALVDLGGDGRADGHMLASYLERS